MTITDTNTIAALTTGAESRWGLRAASFRPKASVRCHQRINPRGCTPSSTTWAQRIA
jgi:hypothetical protein